MAARTGCRRDATIQQCAFQAFQHNRWRNAKARAVLASFLSRATARLFLEWRRVVGGVRAAKELFCRRTVQHLLAVVSSWR